MQAAVDDLASQVGVTKACRVLGVPRSSYYRARQCRRHGLAPAPAACPPPTSQPTPAASTSTTALAPPATHAPRALSAAARAQVRALLNSERFVDCAPREVYATLLDEGLYLCSWSTM